MCKNKGPSHSLCAVPKPSEMLNTANVRRAAIQAEASVGRSWSCTFLPGALDPKTQAALQAWSPGALGPVYVCGSSFPGPYFYQVEWIVTKVGPEPAHPVTES